MIENLARRISSVFAPLAMVFAARSARSATCLSWNRSISVITNRFFSLCLSGAFVVAVVALGGSDSANADTGKASAVCMGAVSKAASTPATHFPVIVPASQVEQLEQRGFSVEPCEGKNNSVLLYRNAICELAETAPQSVKDSLIQTYGVGPDELCQMADEL